MSDDIVDPAPPVLPREGGTELFHRRMGNGLSDEKYTEPDTPVKEKKEGDWFQEVRDAESPEISKAQIEEEYAVKDYAHDIAVKASRIL